MIIGSSVLQPFIRADEAIDVQLPTSISGGEHELFLRRHDGKESNRLRFWIKPQLLDSPGELAEGATFIVTGRAFLEGANVLYNGLVVDGQFVNSTTLSFVVPGDGNQHEKTVSLAVRNPDGRVSNTRAALIPSSLTYGWVMGTHDYSFQNFSLGAPSWSTFEQTFGALEVWNNMLNPVFGKPILTAAFYIFYQHFLKGTEAGGLATGFCTSLAATAADRFWTGHSDTATFVLDAAMRSKLTAIHGRLLSRQTLLTMHDQGRQGTARVAQTFKEIEALFKNGMDRESAPLLFFIPSGAAWHAGYFDKLASSHCVVPIRIVYPVGYDGVDLDGVQLYVWDNNFPHALDATAASNCRVDFRRVDSEIRFTYTAGSGGFTSEEGITLGRMSVGEFLLADHDMPFSGPFGLTSFVLDFLLSPADLQVEDAEGHRTGRYGTQILSEIPDSHPCFLLKGAYLLPQGMAMTRRIVGSGSGTYTWHSLSPVGHSITLEGVSTIAGQVDNVAMNADCTQIRFTPGADKPYVLTLARRIGGQTRAVAVTGMTAGPSAPVDITMSPELSLIRVANAAGSSSAAVRVFCLDEVTTQHNLSDKGVPVPTNHDLLVSVTDWATVDATVLAMPFEV